VGGLIVAIINQYSFVVGALSGALTLGAILWRWRRGSSALRVGLAVLYVAGIVCIRIALNYRTADNTDSLEAVEAALQNEQPSFLMLYSNY
jgi:uncharacterized membrane protein YbhN (UPF0104 family)